VDDVVSAYHKIIKLTNLDFEIFNIGSRESFSVKEISEIINDLFGNKLEIEFIEAERPNEVQDTICKIKKSKQLLGWEPKISLREGLGKMLSWYANND